MSRETVLRQYLSTVAPAYDYAIIDCMPSLGMLTINALTAADSVIIPVQGQYLAAKGLEQLMRTIASVKRQYQSPPDGGRYPADHEWTAAPRWLRELVSSYAGTTAAEYSPARYPVLSAWRRSASQEPAFMSMTQGESGTGVCRADEGGVAAWPAN